MYPLCCLHDLKIKVEIFIFFLVPASLKKLVDNLKIRYVPMCYELEAVLLNLNYKFNKVSGDMHDELLNHYSFKDKFKLSLNF